MNRLPDTGDHLGFYRDAIRLLGQGGIRFLVGGAYALREYTGVFRDTKDFDLFVTPPDAPKAMALFREAGYRAEMTFPHWLAKAHHGEHFIDLIFRAGNGLCEVDALWFSRSQPQTLLDEEISLVPPEEMIWQKAYVMERERFDGADVAHLLRSHGQKLDWVHLLKRFGSDWRVLASHVLLSGFIYPSEGRIAPPWVLARFMEQAAGESESSDSAPRLCRGTLLSRAQYLPDIERWGYGDARIGRSKITSEELALWTAAIGR